ncbi:MAG: (deoxy)nucleoside triphosphate pyrophosphohydrolase [Deltaproteobacteria bacterium]|jgi:8-oxo-dGTP diphosphatase|nr:(deoxy)nucleoside triphosphate pyrophosphohydrolase [Deltaproteobacteria bacterium]
MIEVAAAVIIDDRQNVLICQRAAGGSCACLWEFPGGKREQDETLEECLARECGEELDVTVSVGEKIMETVHAYPDKEVKITFLAAAVTRGTPRNLIHLDCRWVSVESLDQYDFCPADRKMVGRLRRKP